MGREVREFAVTIPKGTTETTPHMVKLTMPPRKVIQITWKVPPGPRGVMGFQIANGKVPVIPITGAYIVTDNQTDKFPLTDYITSGTWWLIGYNTGTFTHTVYLTFTLTLPGTGTSTVGGPPTVQTVGPATYIGTSAPPAVGGSVTLTPLPPTTTRTVPLPTPLPVVTGIPLPPTTTALPTLPTVKTTQPTTPALTSAAGVYQVAPTSTPKVYGGKTYVAISTYVTTISLMIAGVAVYLWTRAKSQPVLLTSVTQYRAVEHTGTHHYTQFVSYRLTTAPNIVTLAPTPGPAPITTPVPKPTPPSVPKPVPPAPPPPSIPEGGRVPVGPR